MHRSEALFSTITVRARAPTSRFPVAHIVAIIAFVFGILAWRASSHASLTAAHSFTRPDFLAAAALFVGATFLLGLLWASMSSVMLPACERIR